MAQPVVAEPEPGSPQAIHQFLVDKVERLMHALMDGQTVNSRDITDVRRDGSTVRVAVAGLGTVVIPLIVEPPDANPA